MKLIEIFNELITEASTISSDVYVLPSNSKINYWDSSEGKYVEYKPNKPLFFNLIKNEEKYTKTGARYWLFVYHSINDGKTYKLSLENDPIANYISIMNRIPLAKEINDFTNGDISNFILSFNWSEKEFYNIINNSAIKYKLRAINNEKVNKKILDFKNSKLTLLNPNQSQRNDFFGDKTKKFGSKITKANNKSEIALRNVGFRQTQIGKPGIKKGDEGELKYSVLDNIVNKIGVYQQISPSVFKSLKDMLRITNSSVKDDKSVLTVGIEFLDESNIFYKVKNSDVLYWGKTNTLSKFYVPEKYGKKVHLTDLKSEDENIIRSHGYKSENYKVLEYKLVIRK